METVQPPVAETLPSKNIDWVNTAVIGLTPPLAILAGILYVHGAGFKWVDLISFGLMYVATGFGICAGYHRYFSHRAFECNRFVQFLMLVFGAAALENSALAWVSDHRYHHRYTDKEEDPYNIQKGFLWAHVGWICFKNAITDREYSNAKDLKKNPLVQWQARYYVPIALITGLGIPFLIGLCFGRPVGGLVWGGIVRLVIVHHATFLINSAAHCFGKKPHSDGTTARDSFWLPFFSFGEGYHNYHHTYPSDYRNGVAWYHWDPMKWAIRALSIPGMTWNLKRSSL